MSIDNRSNELSDDLQLLRRLEQEIGINLEQRDFESIMKYNQVGYALAGEPGHEQVQGLNLDKIELSKGAPLLPGFRYLRRLSLWNCQITNISFLQGMSQLTQLYLGYNKITDYSFLQGMSQLTQLDLSGNPITDYSFLQGMSQLTQLSLIGNPITDFSFLQGLSHLTQLYLSDNQITDISFLQGMSQLTHLYLGSNQITDFSFLQGLSQLTQLYLYNNQITDISFLQGLSQLTKLDLSNNQITDISFLQGMSQLTLLDLSRNKITDISILQGMSQLTQLYLRGNQITDISFLQGMSQLTQLYLSYNQITDISFLQGLRNLKKLDLRNNQITQLPEAFLNLGLEIDVVEKYGGGQKIFLYGNPLEKPPLEIIEKGNAALRAYFDSLKEKNLPLNEVKVLLVGDGAAGKTSLAKQLRGLDFDQHEPQTHGIHIEDCTFRVGGQKIIAHLWDFGGQEIMHATHQFFLSKRSLYILVLDGRREEKTEYWLKHIESFGQNSPVLVVLNKIDENPGFEVNRQFLMENYPNIHGFYRLSCLTGEGLEPFRRALQDRLSRLEMLVTTWAVNWFNVKTFLEKMDDPYISYDRYRDLCRREKIADKTGQETLVGFLNDLGSVLYFKDLDLEDTQVLKPAWVTTAVYRIINSPLLASCGGVLKLDLLDKILAPAGKDDYVYPPGKYRYILQLMKKFELCYEMDPGQVLVPDLLPVEQCVFDFDYDTALTFITGYDFLPRSVMPRFIVRMHRDIKDGLQWRTGVVLEEKAFRSRAVVTCHERERRVIIHVNGEQKRDYFSVIRKTLRDINRGFEKLKTTELVPLPDNPGITIEYDELIGHEAAGKPEIFIGKLRKAYSVGQLLDGISGYEERRNDYMLIPGKHRPDREEPFGPGQPFPPYPVPPPNAHEPMTGSGTDDRVRQIKEWEEKITNLREELETETNKQAAWDKIAERKAHRSSWWFVVLSLLFFGGLAVLIFLVYDWGTMEKWTYLAGVLWIFISVLYFAIFKRRLDSEALRAERLEKEKQELYAQHGVNMKKIGRLNSELQEAVNRKRVLLDSAASSRLRGSA